MVTDGHDQFEEPIKAFLDTMNEYGQDPVDLLATDNPAGDKDFFLKAIASLQATQTALNRLAPPSPQSSTNGLPECTVDRRHVKVLSGASEMNSNIDAMRAQVKGLPLHLRVMSLDAEWDTIKTNQGMVVAQDKIAIIQLSFMLSEQGKVHALILQVHKRKSLPERLLALLADPDITFTGRAIGGDFKKIARDFNCETQTRRAKTIDLGMMARVRDVVTSGVVSLEHLVEVTLGQRLSKAPAVRLSKWSANQLSDEQIAYAALDVIKALEVHLHLDQLPDLTVRLTAAEATAGRIVDIVPSHGSVTVLATRGAVATIEAPGEWTAPDGCRPAKLKPTATRCLVKVTKVLAPSLVVPAVKCDGKPLSLSDLGEPPFLVMLPLGMIKVHVDSSHVRTTADRTASSAAAPEAAATAPSAPAPSSPAISSPPTSDDDADDPEQQLSPITQRQNAAAHAAAHTAAAAAAAANAEPGYTGGGDNDGDGDDPDVSSDDVEMLRAAAVAAAAGDWKALDGLLDPAPEKSTQLLESSSRPGSLRVRLL